jgi:hypothetical protein
MGEIFNPKNIRPMASLLKITLVQLQVLHI